MAKAPDKSAYEVMEAWLESLLPLADWILTLTYDNGKEFVYHEIIVADLEVEGFCATLSYLGKWLE